jgi:hypothetical protein
MVSFLRSSVRLNLEMITRDPLKIPCLTDRYWATFPDMKAAQLAHALHLVQQHATKLPRVMQLPRPELLRVMEENNKACLAYNL